MTQPLPDPLLDEVHDLTLACLSGEASAADVERLDALLFDSEAARTAYANIIRESISLRRWAKAVTVRSEENIDGHGLSIAMPATTPELLPGVVCDTSPEDFAGLTFPGQEPRAIVRGLSSGWPVAYLAATMILGLGLVIGGLIRVSHMSPVISEPSLVRKSLPPSAPRMEIVGRITEMVDCQWSDESTASIVGADVPLGRKYALAAGLLEITYDTGAKVILQGPVTYQAESRAGGYLSAGKLTARLERHASVAQNQKSEIINHKSFAVRTPTAVVNDLGTEFGVEVTGDNVSVVHVFQGSVELHAVSGDKVQKTLRMVEHESARVVRGAGGKVEAMKDAAVQPAAFMRSKHLQDRIRQQQEAAFRRWKAHFEKLSHDPALVAYYDFQRRNESPDLLHAVANASQKPPHGKIQGAVWSTGRMPGKHALRFDGVQDQVVVDLPQRLTQMTLATSIAIEFINDDKESGSGGLLMSDDWGDPATTPGKCHWQILRTGEVCISTVATGRTMTTTVLPWHEWGKQRWRHLAVVMDSAQQRMTSYLDGEPVLNEAISPAFAANFGSARIGNWLPMKGHMPRAFCGRMDELLIMGRTMTADEIHEMFEAGRR